MATILVIDEDVDVLAFVRGALPDRGHHVVTVDRPSVVQKLIQAQVFDAVILEVLMVEREGVETILSLRRRWPHCAIVAMSGGGVKVSAHNALMIATAVGADAVLAKPFSATELSLALEQAMNRPQGPSPLE